MQPFEQLHGDVLRNDDDPRAIGDKDIARIDDNSAAADGVVDFTRPTVQRTDRRGAAGVDGQADRLNAGQVPDKAVHDEAGHAAVLGLGGHQVAQDGVHRRAAGIDDDDVAGTDDVEGLVHHEVVAGKDAHGAGRPPQAVVATGQAVDGGVERVHAVEQIRDFRRRKRAQLLHQERRQPRAIGPDPKPRTGVKLSRPWFLCHQATPLGRVMEAHFRDWIPRRTA